MKNRRKAVQPFEIKKRKIDISEIMKPTVLRKTNGNLRIFLH